MRTLSLTSRDDVSGVGLSSVANQSDARSAYISSARHDHERDRNGASGMDGIAINASAAFVLH